LLEIVPLEALKVAEVHPAVTVVDAGTVSAAAVLESVTLAPPTGAACVSVTMHVLAEPGPMVVGLQLSEETCTDAVKSMLAVADVLL